MHAESAARALREQQLQHREEAVHVAMIRAGQRVARKLRTTTGCLLAGPQASFAQAPASAPALGFFLAESDDSEGGTND